MKGFSYDLVWREAPSADDTKTCYISREKKIPRRVGARAQPFLALLHMSKVLDVFPLYWTVPFIFSWNDIIMLCNLGCNLEQAISADQFKCFREVNESQVVGFLLVPALLL